MNVGNLTLNNIKINKFQWEWKQQLERARRLQLNSHESYKMESEWKSLEKGSEREKTQSSRMLSFIKRSWHHQQLTHELKKPTERRRRRIGIVIVISIFILAWLPPKSLVYFKYSGEISVQKNARFWLSCWWLNWGWTFKAT